MNQLPSDQSPSNRELDELLAQLCESGLTESQMIRFEELVLGNAEAGRRVIEYLQLDGYLRCNLGTTTNAIQPFEGREASQPPVTLSRVPNETETVRNRKTLLGGSAVLSACVIFSIGGMAGWSLRSDARDEPAPIAATSPNAPVAYLTAANSCGWGGGTPEIWTVGRSINSGDELALQEGIAEFRLASGISLGIEGPASLMLVSPSTLVLQYGKLTAHVPWGSSDFKVVSAGCRIIVRDGEFGLSRTGNKLDIHVFSGEVSAGSSIASVPLEEDLDIDGELIAADESHFTDAVVVAGSALQLMTQGEELKIAGWSKSQPGHFVTKLSMSGPLPITQAYVDQVLASKPIAYWRFERMVGSEIPNEIDETAPLYTKNKSLLVGGNGNYSAEFRSDGNCFLKSRATLPLAGSDYSMEAWVKPSHLHLGKIVSISCDENHKSSAGIELQGGAGFSHGNKTTGLLRFMHRTYQGKERDWGTSAFSRRPYAVRRWQHLVATKSGAEMKLYVDGKLSATASDATSFPADVQVRVGYLSQSDSGRKFIGQIDEIAIYNRALAPAEITQHYKTLRQATETLKRDHPAQPEMDAS